MPKIDWYKFVDIKYWLEGIAGTSSITPIIERNSFFFWFFMYFFSFFIIFGIILRLSQAFLHSNHPFQDKIPFWSNSLVSMGILGIIWFVFRQIQVGFLGARIWLLFGLGMFLIFAFFVLRYFIKYYRLEIQYFRKTFESKE